MSACFRSSRNAWHRWLGDDFRLILRAMKSWIVMKVYDGVQGRDRDWIKSKRITEGWKRSDALEGIKVQSCVKHGWVFHCVSPFHAVLNVQPWLLFRHVFKFHKHAFCFHKTDNTFERMRHWNTSKRMNRQRLLFCPCWLMQVVSILSSSISWTRFRESEFKFTANEHSRKSFIERSSSQSESNLWQLP